VFAYQFGSDLLYPRIVEGISSGLQACNNIPRSYLLGSGYVKLSHNSCPPTPEVDISISGVDAADLVFCGNCTLNAPFRISKRRNDNRTARQLFISAVEWQRDTWAAYLRTDGLNLAAQ
jgi:hypothetical protein